MPTTATPRAIITSVLKGEKPKKRLKSLKWDHQARYVLSYGAHYPLALPHHASAINPVDGMPETVLVNVTPSTPTTNRHQRAALEEVHDLGYEERVNRPEIIRGMTYKVFVKGGDRA